MSAEESLKDVVTVELLNEVYDENVRDSDCSADLVRADGHDQIEYERMMRHGHAGRLRKAVKTNRHSGWAPYLWHEVEKSDGGTRTIQIPSYDVATILSAYREHYSEPSNISRCFFTRRKSLDSPPTGLHAAVETAQKALDGGYWAVRVDIENFFDCIPSDVLRSVLNEKLRGVDVPMLTTLLGLPVVRRDGSIVSEGNGVGIEKEGDKEPLSGVPQGAQMAPLIARWVLEGLPAAIPESTKLIVYVDDMLAIAKTREQAESTYATIKGYLENRGLRIHESCDEAIVPPEQPIEFLGEDLAEIADGDSLSDTHPPTRKNTDGRDRQMRSLLRDRDKGPAGLRPAAGRGPGHFPSTGDGPSPFSLPIGDEGNTSGDKCRTGETMESWQDTQGNPKDNEVPQTDSPPKDQQGSISEIIGCTRTVLSLYPIGIMEEEVEGTLISDTHDVARYEDVDPGSSLDRSAPGGAGESRPPAPSRSQIASNGNNELFRAAQDLTAMAELDGSIGLVAVDDADHPSIAPDQVYNATIEPSWGHVNFPDRDSAKWVPDILYVQLSGTPPEEIDEGRQDRIEDVLNRAGNVLRPGGVLVVSCHENDIGAQQAMGSAECGHGERVTADLLPVDGLRPSFGVWQRPSPDCARHLGHLRMPWLRVQKFGSDTYQVKSWNGWSKSTRDHRLNDSAHLSRPIAALHSVVADGIQHATDHGAESLLVVHHGDFMSQFPEGQWSPQKPDLVPPVRRIRSLQDRLSRVHYVREHRNHGIRWESQRVVRRG